MKKPIAKLREDVVKAAMRKWRLSRGFKTPSFERHAKIYNAFNKACAALSEREKGK